MVAGGITKKEYDELMAELDGVTAQLTKTRQQLWKAQDDVKERSDKIASLETHVGELIAKSDKDSEAIRCLKTENSKTLEEEMKVRESLDLMKKVFARTQLKSKEEQEQLRLLQEERDFLLKENQSYESSAVSSKHDKAAINRIKQESHEKERTLNSIMEKEKKNNEEYKTKLKIANENIKTMSRKIVEARDKNESQRQLDKQRLRIDYLERQLLALQEEETDEDLVQRAFIDEDLEESVANKLMQRLDCTSCHDGFSSMLRSSGGGPSSAAC